MGDALYPFEKLYTGIRLLVLHSMDTQVALTGALGEFESAFGHKQPPEWAREGVAKIREIAPHQELGETSEGTIAAWVRQASAEQRVALCEALFELFLTATRVNEQQMRS